MKENLLNIKYKIILLLLSSFTLNAQIFSFEKYLISSEFRANKTNSNKKREYVFKNSNALIKYNPLFVLFGGSLYIYQNKISPLIQFGCLYEPSCSEFARQSLKNFNLLKGILLSADRLTRCTRASSIDLHTVFMLDNNKYFDPIEIYK